MLIAKWKKEFMPNVAAVSTADEIEKKGIQF